MRTTKRMAMITVLVLAIMLLTLPAIGSTADLGNGVTIVDGDVLAPAGTPTRTITMVDSETPPLVIDHGGHRNIVD